MFNPLTTNVVHYIETSQLICKAILYDGVNDRLTKIIIGSLIG